MCLKHTILYFSAKGPKKQIFSFTFRVAYFQRSMTPFLTRSLKAHVCLSRHYQSMRNQFSLATIRKIYNKHGKNRPENQQSSEQIWAVLKLCGKLAIIWKISDSFELSWENWQSSEQMWKVLKLAKNSSCYLDISQFVCTLLKVLGQIFLFNSQKHTGRSKAFRAAMPRCYSGFLPLL